MIVRSNPQVELSEFYPPPYDFLGSLRRCRVCGLVHPVSVGMGQVSASQIQSIATTGASTTVSMLTALGTVGGPIGAAAGALIAVGSLIAGLFKGCGSSCVLASNDANKIEPLLQQNLQAYLSSPTRTTSLQAAALNNFNTVWQALEQACSDPSLGAAGQRCISDRQQGSCAYKTSPGGWQQQNGVWTYVYPGANGSGSTCWNWFVGYHDPIANDPAVVPDPTTSAAATTTSITAAPASTTAPGGTPTVPTATAPSINLNSLLLPAGVIGVGLILAIALGGD